MSKVALDKLYFPLRSEEPKKLFGGYVWNGRFFFEKEKLNFVNTGIYKKIPHLPYEISKQKLFVKVYSSENS